MSGERELCPRCAGYLDAVGTCRVCQYPAQDAREEPSGEPCPQCTALLDIFHDTDGAQDSARPGDVTVCVYCGAILEVLDGNEMRVLGGQEIMAFDADFQRSLLEAVKLAGRARALGTVPPPTFAEDSRIRGVSVDHAFMDDPININTEGDTDGQGDGGTSG